MSGSIVLLIAGPSGVGKTTLCGALLAAFPGKIMRAITSTSRLARPDEVEGRDYYFLSSELFVSKIQKGEFYEYAQVHGQWKGVFKAEILSKMAASQDVLVNVDVQGARTYRSFAQTDPALKGRLVTVFMQPPSQKELQNRLVRRGDVPESEFAQRLRNAQIEMEHTEDFDHVLISSTPQKDLEALTKIYLEAKSKQTLA